MERIPTEEEVSRLPRLAQVALAARCARQVLPIYDALGKAGDYWRQVVPDAVATAEQSASTGDTPNPDEDPAAAAAAAAAIAATYPANYAANAASAAAAAAYAAHSAHFAHSAAIAAANAVDAAADPSAYADAFADEAACERAIQAADAIKTQVKEDFTKLMSAAEEWTDETAVPADFLEALPPADTVPESFSLLSRYHKKKDA